MKNNDYSAVLISVTVPAETDLLCAPLLQARRTGTCPGVSQSLSLRGDVRDQYTVVSARIETDPEIIQSTGVVLLIPVSVGFLVCIVS